MLVTALVLAIVGLAALVFAVVTSNALVAWVCIGASGLGVLLLIVDALRERRRHEAAPVKLSDGEERSGEAEPASEADQVVDAAVAADSAETPDVAEDADAPATVPADQEADDGVVDEDQNVR